MPDAAATETKINTPELARAAIRSALGVRVGEAAGGLGFTSERAGVVREASRRIGLGQGREALNQLAQLENGQLSEKGLRGGWEEVLKGQIYTDINERGERIPRAGTDEAERFERAEWQIKTYDEYSRLGIDHLTGTLGEVDEKKDFLRQQISGVLKGNRVFSEALGYPVGIPLEVVDANLRDERIKLNLAKFLNTAYDITTFNPNDEELLRERGTLATFSPRIDSKEGAIRLAEAKITAERAGGNSATVIKGLEKKILDIKEEISKINQESAVARAKVALEMTKRAVMSGRSSSFAEKALAEVAQQTLAERTKTFINSYHTEETGAVPIVAGEYQEQVDEYLQKRWIMHKTPGSTWHRIMHQWVEKIDVNKKRAEQDINILLGDGPSAFTRQVLRDAGVPTDQVELMLKSSGYKVETITGADGKSSIKIGPKTKELIAKALVVYASKEGKLKQFPDQLEALALTDWAQEAVATMIKSRDDFKKFVEETKGKKIVGVGPFDSSARDYDKAIAISRQSFLRAITAPVVLPFRALRWGVRGIGKGVESVRSRGVQQQVEPVVA